MTEISVLIPTYNDRILSQVSTLQSQLEALSVAEDLCYEVVVADDCSTDEAVVRENEEILHLDHCRLVREPHNVGRAAIRNRLAQEARYRWLLYIDAQGLRPSDRQGAGGLWRFDGGRPLPASGPSLPI